MADENINCCIRIWRSCFSRRIVMYSGSLASVVLGIGAGILLKSHGPLSVTEDMLLGIPEKMLMQALSFVFAPFVLSTIIIGITRPNMSSSRKINSRAITYFISSTILSVLLGVLLVRLIQPGIGLEVVEGDDDDDDDDFSTVYTISDLFRNVFPRNILEVGFKKYKTVKVLVKPEENDSFLNVEATQGQVLGNYVNQINIPGMVLVSFIIGIALRSIGDDRRIFVDQVILFNRFFKFALKLFMCFLPVGFGSMIARFIHETEYNWEMLISLGKFTAAVIGGLVIHGAVVLPLVYLVCMKQNPYSVIGGASSACLHVLLVPRSNAVSKVYFCCEEVIMIDRRITNFMLPMGLKFNMDGTAFYEMAVAVYISQLNGITLNWASLFTLGVTVALAAVGKAGVPTAGTVTTLFVLSASGISARNAALPLAVEWLLYFFISLVNILGNCFGVALVAHLSRQDLDSMNNQVYASATLNP